MRSSILSRSVVALATVAISSAALAATPANAASAGVTRDQVLTAANGVRTAQANETTSFSPATARALRAIVIAGCDVSSDDDEYAYISYNDIGIQVTPAGDDAQGLVVTAQIQRPFTNGGPFGNSQYCTIAAFASTNASYKLSGTATFTGQSFTEGGPEDGTKITLQSAPLSGDVFVSAPFNYDNPVLDTVDEDSVRASAAGNATKTTKVTTSRKVKDKKTTSEKKAAKTKYDKRIKAAKKSYAKALDKAGSSKSKKAAAKKAYKAKRASAKAKFKYGIAGYKIVKKSSNVSDVQPFSVTTAPVFSNSSNLPNFPLS
ncbi:hypothetical protein [Aeromicrobium endophyticum]|uniref:Uncharacterized protein n=1 Tax=Aeromicrobium endophyticum TaxID=2292704 RepID=A0A371PBU9_9ACTN|nr:hypothetical protein [Aeromicrobium endophyticum]REK73038.1 hypothetical protein DX116_05475 [Aeromicrobium endophyticum]